MKKTALKIVEQKKEGTSVSPASLHSEIESQLGVIGEIVELIDLNERKSEGIPIKWIMDDLQVRIIQLKKLNDNFLAFCKQKGDK